MGFDVYLVLGKDQQNVVDSEDSLKLNMFEGSFVLKY